MPEPDLRGANQSLVGLSSPDWADWPGSAAGSTVPVLLGVAVPGAVASLSAPEPVPVPVLVPPEPPASVTGLRTTTGGMGRDPGMLIRIRVVSVVSVLRSSGRVAERPASVPPSETVGVPYGGVPDG
ncbi:hypothetical protein CA983_30545 [Streptomyces swartbergensis]|uniref:Uncharacterized protein n=1 Tax=Streptomyces swartbergensis TaxID=487165 RepID=A0A243RQV3_9ACTN|nr:hypothetical protein CA983_30545 [Streptomyces swartbergensis]